MGKALEIVHPNAAGIDIGSRGFFVDAGEDEIRVFTTYTEGCHALRDYLLIRKIKTVALESTGVYWVILHAVLEEAGIEVYLVNGREAKNVPGRKSDVKDCQWLRQLHSYGLLRKSFIPDDSIGSLRNYMRLRQDHIRATSTQILLMQKALTLMNIRLTETINDITGASGLQIITAILDGERNVEKLTAMCHTSILKAKKDMVMKALEGTYSDDHLFALEQAHRTWKHYNKLIDECDKRIEKLLKKMAVGKKEIEIKNKRKPIRYHAPKIKDLHKPLLKLTEGKDPTTIAGITDYSFLQLISEVGTELTQWKTEKHFVSWLKLCPQRNSSGKMMRKVNVKHHNKASWMFRNIAQGLLNSKHLAIGVFGRRVRAKRGSAVAIKAVARKIACYFYRVMTKGDAFVERGIELYQEQLMEQKRKYLQRQARNLNLELVPISI